MDKRHEQSLLYALDVLKQDSYRQFVKAVYLYGSCARGSQKFHSDVDLFLFVSSAMTNSMIRMLRSEITPDDDTWPEVDLKISKCAEPTSSRQFNENLKKDGILLWHQQ